MSFCLFYDPSYVVLTGLVSVWYSDSRNRGYLSPRIRGDPEGMKTEIEARRAKRREMRPSQPDVEYPVFKLEDMLKVPKHAQPPA